MFAIITFLPEPLYTVVMAMAAVGITVVGAGLIFKVCMRLLDFDGAEAAYAQQQNYEEAQNQKLNQIYFLRDEFDGREYEVLTAPSGQVKTIQSGNTFLMPGNDKPLMVVQSEASEKQYFLTDENGQIIKKMQITDRHIHHHTN